MTRDRSTGVSGTRNLHSADGSRRGSRGQTGLPALAIALLVLTVVTGLGLAIADGALASAERDAGERRVASSLSERLVASGSPLTTRPNVLNGTRLDRLDGPGLEGTFPVTDGHAVRLRVNGSTVAATETVRSGTTFRRLVVVEREQTRTIRPALGTERVVTIPRRTGRATLAIRPPSDATVTTVRANDRVVLRNPDGLAGEFDVDLSRFETTRLHFAGTGALHDGNVTVRYPAPRTTKTTLEVTVDG